MSFIPRDNLVVIFRAMVALTVRHDAFTGGEEAKTICEKFNKLWRKIFALEHTLKSTYEQGSPVAAEYGHYKGASRSLLVW